MTSLDDHPTEHDDNGQDPPHPQVAGPRRAWRLLCATLAVWRGGLVAAGHRHGPRAARAATRTRQNLAGAAEAFLLALLLWGRPLAHAWAASPRWAEIATALAARLCARVVALSVAAVLLLCWLVGPFSTVGVILLVPALAWLTLRGWVAFYPHTIRGRVRVRYEIDGFAGYWDLHRHLSAHAVRQVAPQMRPSIAAALPEAPDNSEQVRAVGGPGIAAGVRARRLWLVERLPVTECGTWLGRSSVGPVWGTECYAAHRDVIGLIAPPQTGKTALMGHHILDHCGAVVSTSTKTDLYLSTAAIRAVIAAGHRVHLFNPEDLGGLGSTLRWSPVRGCEFPRTANQRAGHLVGAARSGSGGGGGDDNARWDEWAVGVLAALLMSAARGGESMETVAHWVFTQKTGAEQALKLLCEAAGTPVPPLVIDALSQVTTTEARKTRDAIFLTLRQAVGFMADPDIAAICCPAADEPVFDVANFIADHGTLYILGSDDKHSGIAPLLAALTGYVFETAKHLAADYPKGRLDPPLMLALDEAALITPVPLDRWLADAGGRGIHVIWAVQSPSQLAATWGQRGADTIMNATNITMIYGGLKLDADLDAISKLCGTRLELVPDPDGDGSGHARFERVPVIPPARVRTIPQWHALLIHRATLPTLVKLVPYWERADVRAGPVPQVPPINEPAASLVTDDPGTPTPGEPGPRPRPAIAPPGIDGDSDNLSDTPRDGSEAG